MATFRRPGVYIEEAKFLDSSESGASQATTLFVGACERGPTMDNVSVGSWSDYVSVFGEFNPAAGTDISFLPYAVYSYFQNGGRGLTIRRAVGAADGVASSYDVLDGTPVTPLVAFTLTAKSAGEWGDSLKAEIVTQGSSMDGVYNLNIWKTDEYGNDRLVETFTDLSCSPTDPSLRTPAQAVNDEIYGSKYVTAVIVNPAAIPDPTQSTLENGLFSGGDEPDAPTSAELNTATAAAIDDVYGSVLLYAAGHYLDGSWTPSTFDVSSSRLNVFLIQDGAPPRGAGDTSAEYAGTISSDANLTRNLNSSQAASYTPWLVIPSPQKIGTTQLTPPGGAVAGVISRMDYSSGVFRSPAGIIASVNNVINVDAKFSDSDLASLNNDNINVIRPVAGNGVCIMGARTRKPRGVDRFIAARRTLIQIEQQLQDATVFAVFENNDELLWSRLRTTANRILQPIWSAGGLRGGSASEAYFITCDASINTPQVIASGEVRMEIGVALEYPAEFIVIRLSQFDGGSASRTALA